MISSRTIDFDPTSPPQQPHRTRGCFVTGTDTDAGKTTITAGMARVLAAEGLRVAALKPVSAGMERQFGRLVNPDVQALFDAGNVALSDAEIGPIQLQAYCAPHIAAQLEGRRIERAPLVAAVQRAAERADVVLVEGAGGFLVPFGEGNDDWNAGDLAVELGLPVVLVVRMTLGCINHALLTAEAIRGRGMRLAGWVANHSDRQMIHQDKVFTYLCGALRTPCLARVPYLEAPSGTAAAKHMDGAQLRRALVGFAA